ncbi:voltage dependent anion channel 3 [Striga asiatica]|uniref:Voltage dependent anion channel 3 n=1 Tax=Striga asiatica TaxID=4170 RepID=A0A5A7QMJ3_STRAF|nr:voltage dependent anion channel 3 [Striga asiatica]
MIELSSVLRCTSLFCRISDLRISAIANSQSFFFTSLLKVCTVGTNKGRLFFGEINPVPEDHATWLKPHRATAGHGGRFPDGRLITCYHMGMVRDMLLSSCSPDWGHAERFATDFGLKLNEATIGRTEI